MLTKGTLAQLYLVGMIFCISSARSEEIVTDRPDQTESSQTVPPGLIQLEMGWTHSVDNDDIDKITNSFPEILIRCGIVDDFEIRLGYDGYMWEDIKNSDGFLDDEEGSGDPVAGFKFKFRDESGWLPEAAFLSQVTIPAGTSPFSSERADPSYRFAFSHTLTGNISFAYNFGQVWQTEMDDHHDLDTRSIFIYTSALGIGITDRLGAYVEFFGDIPTGSFSDGPRNSFNGGFTYLLEENIQFDIALGTGLSESADDWFVGVGLSILFP